MILQFDIPDAKAQKVIDAFCNVLGYQPNLIDLETGAVTPNPQTKAQFVRSKIVDYMKSVVSSHERQVAAEGIVVTDIGL